MLSKFTSYRKKRDERVEGYLKQYPNREKLKNWFTDNTPAASLLALSVGLVVVLNLTFLFKGPGHWEGVLVESWGMLFDLAIIGFLVTGLVRLGERRQKIQSYLDIIDDFRGWESDEAAHRIRGAIWRLSLLGVDVDDLRKCTLRGVNLKGLNFKKANLWNAHLERSDLQEVHLEEALLIQVHLEEAKLCDAHLEGAVLHLAHLEGADLRIAHLEGADLEMAHLEGAYLLGTHLDGAVLKDVYLDGAALIGTHLEGVDFGSDLNDAVISLSKAKTLYGVRNLDKAKHLGPELKSRLEKECPHLFIAPQVPEEE